MNRGRTEPSAAISRRKVIELSGIAAGGLLVGGTLTSCGGGSGSGGGSELVFSSYLFSDFKSALMKVLKMWEKQNPKARLQTQFAGGDQYWTKVQTQVAGGTPPDVGIGENANVVSYAKDGLLLDLNDRISREHYSLERFLPSALAQYRWHDGKFDSGSTGGHMYGLPSDAQGFIFAYNKAMFDDAGVDYPTDDWTWDDVVDAARQITDPSTKKWGINAPALGTLYRGNFVYSAGGRLTTPNFKRSALDRPETVDAYQWVWDLIYKHRVSPRPTQSQSQQVDLFASGRVAMAVDGIWMVSTWKNIKEFDWDIALLPKHPETGRRTTSVESDGWWVYRGAGDQDLAWDLLKFLVSDKAQRVFSKLNYVVPPSLSKVGPKWYDQGQPPSLEKALQNVENDSQKRDGAFYKFPDVDGAITPILQKAFFGGRNLPSQMREAAGAMNEVLQKAWRDF